MDYPPIYTFQSIISAPNNLKVEAGSLLVKSDHFDSFLICTANPDLYMVSWIGKKPGEAMIPGGRIKELLRQAKENDQILYIHDGRYMLKDDEELLLGVVKNVRIWISFVPKVIHQYGERGEKLSTTDLESDFHGKLLWQPPLDIVDDGNDGIANRNDSITMDETHQNRSSSIMSTATFVPHIPLSTVDSSFLVPVETRLPSAILESLPREPNSDGIVGPISRSEVVTAPISSQVIYRRFEYSTPFAFASNIPENSYHTELTPQQPHTAFDAGGLSTRSLDQQVLLMIPKDVTNIAETSDADASCEMEFSLEPAIRGHDDETYLALPQNVSASSESYFPKDGSTNNMMTTDYSIISLLDPLGTGSGENEWIDVLSDVQQSVTALLESREAEQVSNIIPAASNIQMDENEPEIQPCPPQNESEEK